MKLTTTLATTLITFSTLNAHAALIDRGNGMIYDSTQNITWLQDATYAETSGYNLHGDMTWTLATAWAANLNYGGFSGWRLPSAGLNGTNLLFSYDGSTDYSYNNTRSEIGHLYYELGNLGHYNAAGVAQQGYGFTHTGPFLNVSLGDYWEGDQFVNPGQAWFFYNSIGSQSYNGYGFSYFAWAVHDGDVAAVPIPASAWLFGSGLIGLVGTARRTQKAA